MEAFHKKQGSRNVKFTGWNESGERCVSYSVAIQAPAILTNIVGAYFALLSCRTVKHCLVVQRADDYTWWSAYKLCSIVCGLAAPRLAAACPTVTLTLPTTNAEVAI